MVYVIVPPLRMLEQDFIVLGEQHLHLQDGA